MQYKFTIVITTKNRLEDLKVTLEKLKFLLTRGDVHVMICDDGSADGTSKYVQSNFPDIQLIKNSESKGLIYSRNRLLNLVTTQYAISLDDDAHFITKDPLEIIENAFNNNPKVALLSFRIFWDLREPEIIYSNEFSYRVKSFVGCGHVWRMDAWKDIPNYPSWFVFYGEEDFASYQMFKKKWEVYYLPEVLINHRVDVKGRKKNKDYSIRLRRSLRAGWYLYFLFYPLNEIPKRFLYTLWIQFKTKVFKGDFKALYAILRALLDLIYNLVRLAKQSNRLTRAEFDQFMKLSDTKLYWRPEHEKICN
ncbi:glycosyltransferase [Flavobacterium zhairuonense]|uniref:glycosyltransferase family 2 protein n=1 Tax=Flavobacterium zhairuonense TaxID=2493631 RepID=UPI001052C2A5|nr:glycosyltransferase [Flavobacterium zhairuonense]KAF2510812.1 glycosyltransferase [Flavobacterium zhairuonense]